jgi:type I restriction enzyme R subunit
MSKPGPSTPSCDANLRDHMDENVVARAFHHNAFLIFSNGHRARYGSITSEWDYFADWKRLTSP